MTDEMKKGKLVIVSGPSGVGKSTICDRVIKALDAFLSVSATTRFKGANEVDGQNYWYLTGEEFQDRIKRGEFLEYAEVYGNYYGTPKPPVLEALHQGRTVILEIDVQGGLQVQKQIPEAIMVFILPPRKEVLEERINGRGRGEDSAAKQRRLDTASREIAQAWQHYDHLIVNDNLDQAVKEVIDAIDGKIEEKI